MLAQGLVARGHHVTLFAHPDSRTAGKLIPWAGGSSVSRADTVRNAAQLWREARRHQFDLIHSFSRLAYMAPLLPHRIPKIMSYQRAISPRTTALAHRLAGDTLWFTAISRWMMARVRERGTWRLVPNGVPLGTFSFRDHVAPDAPLVFLGRIEDIKGPHLAIEVARRTGRNLVIAGNVPPDKQAWFDKHVAPHIDGGQISYVGPVDDSQKSALLGQAAAFLMPILWDEPFGIVMAEALACGTPVIALDRGAACEVVADGITGFVRSDLDGLVESVRRIEEIDRAACRQSIERYYSADVIVDAYCDMYRAHAGRSAC